MSGFVCCNGVWRNARGDEVKTAPMQRPDRYPIQCRIPYEWAEEAYQEYAAQYGDRQSLERLNERGGFGAEEIISLLVDRIRRIASAK